MQLKDAANLSTGGEAIDRTEVIHPDNAAIARRAARAVGLDIAGIDFISPDITRSAHEIGGGVVEVNAAPGFRMHLEPSQGRARNVAAPVIDMLFPRRRAARIPLVAITGTNGKSTVVRMVARIFTRHGWLTGMTTTSGVYIGEERVYVGDASGPKSARLVLADPTVEAAVLETARGGILREGLGFDRCDVGCVLNITADHLGVKGINSLSDLAAVKSVVTEAVARRGVSVLNGDDPFTLRMARHAGGRIAYFSLQGGEAQSSLLQKHIAGGGLAATLEPGGMLTLFEGGQARPILKAEQVPATLEGLARFNIANALAAVLVAHGAGVPLTTIAQALSVFQSSFEDNPGRLNVHDAHGFRVILDYAHNPAGLSALGGLIQGLGPRHGRVIGCVSIPGDRRDEDIRAMGALASELFDEIVFRERPDGRGRASGEVMRLMREGAIEAGFEPRRLQCIAGEAGAIRACLEKARPGDLVILLPTDVDGAWRQVQAFRPAGRASDTAGTEQHV